MKAIRRLEKNSKIASRRFSKSIVCRILTGPVVGFIIANNLLPPGIVFNDINVAYSSNKNRVVIIPLFDFPDYEEVLALAGLGFSSQQDQTAGSKGIIDSYGFKDLLQAEHALRKKEPLLKFLKQNMIVAAVNPVTIPKNLPRLLADGSLDIIIDSIDTTQSVYGTFVPRSRTDTSGNEQWNDE